MTITTGGLRCHNPEACCAGQKPCPSPGACGVAAPAPPGPSAHWKFNSLYADTEVRSLVDDKLLAVVFSGPERAHIVSLLKGAPRAKILPSDAEIEAFREAFDWDGWTCPHAAQRAFARAALARWSGTVASEDGGRLDYLQQAGATIEILPGTPGHDFTFRVGGMYATRNASIRAAIDAARAASRKEGGAA